MKSGRNNFKPRKPSSPPGHPSLAQQALKATTPVFRERPKWVFRLAALLVLPVLLCGVEAAMRLAGYGYSSDFFKHIRIGGEDFWVDNDKFGLRFFPPDLARSPAPVVMRAKKPVGTYRIFILGESAALGDPRPAYGAGRYLQVLLRERFPTSKFEVINLSMTAINSHAVLSIARECAHHEGDLWIIYMGNNEMVGPFGAATIFGAQAPPLPYVRLSLALQKTRLGQWIVALSRKLRGQSSNASRWAGMVMFLQNKVSPLDPRKASVYHNFQRNLRDILRTGRKARAKIILSTVAVNLKDCPPFASMSQTNRSTNDRNRWDKLYAEGSQAQAGTNYAQAIKLFAQAAKLEPDSAELHFRWADCLLGLNKPGARQQFELARDLDALPFRADSRLNELLTAAGSEFGGSDLAWFDAAELFATNSTAGVPGQEIFYEHVHFNFDGNYRLAKAWAEQVNGLLSFEHSGTSTPQWASQAICEQRLGLTDWNRYSVLEDMNQRLAQPPFTMQPNQTDRLESIRSQMRDMRKRMDRPAAEKAREVYWEALDHAPEDHRIHENFAEFLEDTGDLAQATAQWQRVRELVPQHHVAYFHAGRLLVRQNKLESAEPLLHQALALRPDLAEGWLELGKIHALQGKPELALKEYELERQLAPQDSRAYYHKGKALSALGRTAEAVEQLRQAVRLRPAFWEAHYALGEELGIAGKLPEARAELEEAIRLKPDYPAAHLNLGVTLVQQGNLEAALKEFEETRRLDPHNQRATEYLEKVRAKLSP